jgi:hypothetical protein
MRKMTLAVLGMLCSATVQAAPVTPTFDTFDVLPGAEFESNSPEPSPAASSVFAGMDGDIVTIGLTAIPRFLNPPLRNDGAGIFHAKTGENSGDPDDTNPDPAERLGPTWSVGIFIDVQGQSGNTVGDYQFQLFYDFDPGEGTDLSELGVLNLSAVSGPRIDSNIDMGLDAVLAITQSLPGLGSVTAPAFGPFDPLVQGEYSFLLRSAVVADSSVAINVQAVPLPGAAAFLLTGLGSLLFFRRRSRRFARTETMPA